MRLRTALLLALAAISLAATGCGYVATGLTAALIDDGSGSGSGGVVTLNSSLSAEIVQVPRPNGPVQSVRVRIFDKSGAGTKIPLSLEYRTAGGSALIAGAAPIPGVFVSATLVSVTRVADSQQLFSGSATETPALESSASGVEYIIGWAWQTDLGLDSQSGVTLRLSIVGTSGFGGGVAFTASDQTIGNNPPVLSSVQVTGSSGVIQVAYGLKDSLGDVNDIQVKFQFEAEPALPIVLAAGSPPITAVTTNGDVRTLTLFWNSLDPTQVGARRGGVVLTLEAIDGGSISSGIVRSQAFQVLNASPSQAFIQPPARATGGTVTVPYTLVDAESDATTLTAVWSIPSGASGTATAAGGDGVSGLAASPAGTPHTFIWNYQQDLGSNAASQAQLTLRSVEAGALASTAGFLVGNDAPVAAIAPISTTVTGDRTLTISLSDSSADPASIEVQYSTDGTSFFTASSASPTIALPASSNPASPTAHPFVWQSAADLPTLRGGVTLRARANDGLVNGQGAFVTATARVENVPNAAPVAGITTPPRATTGGFLNIDYTVADAESDTASALIEVSKNGGAFFNATPGSGGNPVTGLSTSQGGASHTFSWSYGSIGDVGLSASKVVVRVTPSDSRAGTPVQTPQFVIGNDPPVLAILSTYPQVQSGPVPIQFTLFDTSADPASVDVRFSTDGGANFAAATLAAAVTRFATTAVGDPTQPATNAILWRSDLDLPNAQSVPVVLKLTPSDAPLLTIQAPLPATVGAVVRNGGTGRQPFAIVSAPGRSASGSVSIPFTLVSPDGNTCTAAVAFSTAGGASGTFQSAGASLAGLTATAQGFAHAFVWSYGAAIGVSATSNVVFQVTPSDANGPGVPGQSVAFITGNDKPVLSGLTASDGPDTPVVAFTLTDTTGDVCSVAAAFTIGGGAPVPITAVAAGSPTTLTASPAGAAFSFAWDAALQLAAPTTVAVVLTPRDGFVTGTAVTSATFTAGPSGRRPAVFIAPIVRTLGSVTSGAISIPYTPSDLENDIVSVTVTYRLGGAGAPLFPASLAAGGEGITGLAPNVQHAFLWDYKKDLGNNTATANVQVRITGSDPFGAGGPQQSAPFVVGNDAPALVGPVTVNDGPEQPVITFTIRDSTSDLSSIRPSYRIGAGAAVAITSAFIAGSTTALTASPAGTTFSFGWNAAAQLPSLTTNVAIVLIPNDGFADGTAATSTAFTAGPVPPENHLPSATVATPLRTAQSIASSLQPISYTLVDPDGETLTAIVQVSYPGSGGFVTATQGGGAALGALTATAQGFAHTFDWNYLAQLGGTTATSGVVIRVTPSDLAGAGFAGSSPTFGVGNGAPVVGTPTIAGTQAQPVISFTLADSTGDTCVLRPAYKVGAAAPVTITASFLAGTTTLTATPAGASFSFGWNAAGQLGVQATGVAIVLVANDGFTDGNTATSATFTAGPVPVAAPVGVPVAAVPRPARSTTGTVAIPYTLFDSVTETGLVRVAVDVSLDGGTTFAVAVTTGATTGLSASPQGVAQTVTWNYAAQLPGPVTTNAVIRITPSNATVTGVSDVTPAFTVGNEAPKINAVSVAGAQAQPIVSFTLEDSTSDVCSVHPAYKIGAGSPITITAGFIVGAGATTLTAMPAPGASFSFAWNAAGQLGVQATGVAIVLVANDGLASGNTATSATFTAGPEPGAAPVGVPVAAVTKPARSTSGTVAIPYTLFDNITETGAIRVAVDVSLDGGTTFAVAVTTGATTGLSASPQGVTQTVAWSYAAQFPGLVTTNAVIRITPSSATIAGISGATPAFTVGNDAPKITAVSVAGTQAQPIVSFTLEDSTSDVCSVHPAYKVGAGLPVTITAGFIVGGTGTTTLTAVPAPGTSFSFAWNASGQLGVETPGVTVVLTPDDGLASGPPATSAAFTAGPTAGGGGAGSRPIALISELTANPDRVGTVSVEYMLFDQDSSPVDVVLQWAPEGDAFPSVTSSPFGDLTDAGVRQSVLADPAKRKALGILTESPLPIEGVAEPGSTADTIACGALAAQGLVTASLVGKKVEILEGPSPTAIDVSLIDPVGVILEEGGETALVAESTPSSGSTTISRVTLATGAKAQVRVFGVEVTGISRELGSASRLVGTGPGGVRRLNLADGSAESNAVDSVGGVAGIAPGAAVASDGVALALRLVLWGPPTTDIITTGVNAGGIAVSPDGLSALMVDQSTGKLRTFDILSRRFVESVPFFRADVSGGRSVLAVSPDGRRVVGVSTNPALLVATDFPSGSARRAIPLSTPAAAGASIGADGRVLFLDGAPAKLLSLNGVARARTLTAVTQSPPALSVAPATFDRPTVGAALPAGTPFRIPRGRNEGETSLASTPSGVPHRLAWNTLADGVAQTPIRVRAVPFDAGGQGTADSVFGSRTLARLEPRADLPSAVAATGTVALADFDQDGDLDLLYDRPGLKLQLLIQADGAFGTTPDVSIAYAGALRGVAVGDANGDGLPDVVHSTNAPAAVKVSINDGTPSFNTRDTAFSGTTPGVVAIGKVLVFGTQFDLVAVAFSLEDTIEVLIPDGSGSFVTGFTLSFASAVGVRFADAIGEGSSTPDGNADIVCWSTTNTIVRIMPWNPSQVGFGDVTATDVTTTYAAIDVVPADVDQDGTLDLIAGNASDTIILFGPFTPAASAVVGLPSPGSVLAARDLDGDGRLDVIAAQGREVVVYRQTAARQFEEMASWRFPSSAAFTGAIGSLATGDLDADGDPDIVAGAVVPAGAAGVLADLRTIERGGFRPLGRTAGDIGALAAEIEGFAPPGSTSVPVAATAADLNGDGAPDIVMADEGTDALEVHLQTAPGRFGDAPVHLQPGTAALAGPSDVAVADLDGDGRPDVAGAGRVSGTIALFRQSGAPGSFEPSPFVVLRTPTSTAEPVAVVAADLDGDGDVDIASANAGSNDVTVFQSPGAGAFPAVPGLIRSVTAPRALVAADLDGDGKMDLAVASFGTGPGTGAIALFTHAGGTLTPQADADLVGLPQLIGLAAADVNGDGRVDLVALPSSGPLLVFANQGGGTFAAATSLGTGNGASVAAGDVDGDGFADVVRGLAEGVEVYLGSATGLGSVAAIAVNPQRGGAAAVREVVGLRLADLDGDGDLEIVAAGRTSRAVAVLSPDSLR